MYTAVYRKNNHYNRNITDTVLFHRHVITRIQFEYEYNSSAVLPTSAVQTGCWKSKTLRHNSITRFDSIVLSLLYTATDSKYKLVINYTS